MQSNDIKYINIKFNITKEQIEKVSPYIDNVEELVEKGLKEFLIELNDAIVGELDTNYRPTETSSMLQEVYDEVYNKN